MRTYGRSSQADIRQSQDSDKGRSGRFWTSARELRLLEWVEKNPIESSIIYTKRLDWKLKGCNQRKYKRLISKSECLNRAAQAIFAVDEDIVVRKKLEDNRAFFDLRVRGQLCSWKEQYEKIKEEMKAVRPAPKLDEIREGTQAYKDLAKYHSDFPYWGRLNAQWHGLPSSEGLRPATQARTKRRISQRIADRDTTIVVDSDNDTDTEEMSVATSDVEEFIEGSSQQPANTLKRKHRNAIPSSATELVERPKTSRKQESGLEVQKVKLEIQKLENDALRLKMKMERQKGIQEERRSLREALVGLINSLPGETDDMD